MDSIWKHPAGLRIQRTPWSLVVYHISALTSERAALLWCGAIFTSFVRDKVGLEWQVRDLRGDDGFCIALQRLRRV